MTDWDRVDRLTLALMHLTSFEDHGVTRTWKGYDWEVLGRLFENGFISNPVSKAKSVVLTDRGREASLAAFQQEFAQEDAHRRAAGSGLCECGCGEATESDFRPGHDQKLRAALEARVGGLLALRELVDLGEALAHGRAEPDAVKSKVRDLFRLMPEE
jgi:hypothetical protein